MKARLLISLAALSLSFVAQAAQPTCPDLSGRWVGTCRSVSNNVPKSLLKLQPMIQPLTQEPSELTIVQIGAGSPLTCRMITIDGSATTIGGLHTESLSVPLNSAEPISIGYANASNWTADSLVTKASGVVLAGTAISFGANSRMTLNADGSLSRVLNVQGDGFSAEASCDYQRQP